MLLGSNNSLKAVVFVATVSVAASNFTPTTNTIVGTPRTVGGVAGSSVAPIGAVVPLEGARKTTGAVAGMLGTTNATGSVNFVSTAAGPTADFTPRSAGDVNFGGIAPAGGGGVTTDVPGGALPPLVIGGAPRVGFGSHVGVGVWL